MKALYIGIYTEGTTSKMRALELNKLLPGWEFSIIDTDVPFNSVSRISRTAGFRYKMGPLINKVNQYVLKQLQPGPYDLIWVDKAIYFKASTTAVLKQRAKILVHYTPDVAFYANVSKLFNKSIPQYDYVITTKNFEVEAYTKWKKKENILLTTQGYDKEVHKPAGTFADKKNRVAFIGLCEPARERVLQYLLDNQIRVKLAGKNWEAFAARNKNNELLEYIGSDIRGAEYSKLIASSYFSIGLLSRKFPELHTTRTFEIPACGTALLTEKNVETASFFSDNEVIFFENENDLVKKIQYYSTHLDELERITYSGLQKVQAAGYDYHSILKKLLSQVLHGQH